MTEYKCNQCQNKFEKEEQSCSCCSGEKAACPSCGSENIAEVKQPTQDVNDIMREFFSRKR